MVSSPFSLIMVAITLLLWSLGNTTQADVAKPSFYGHSYALVIGNDDYTNGWPKLGTAVKDAELVSAALTKQGYDVETLFNTNSVTLQNSLRQFFIVKGKEPDARLLLWFAGHGQTLNGEGFIVATDTPATSDDSFKLSAIHMRDFGSWVRLADSKHVLAIFDSCFSGTVFAQQRGAPPSITRAISQPVREFLTSGDADQAVFDNGLFRDLFIRSINGEESADLNGDGYLTASELGYFMSDRMTNVTNAMQTPRYGKLMDKNYNQGEFILAVLNPGQTIDTAQAQLKSSDNEPLVWKSATDINSIEAYQAYLKRYPQGAFADLAYVQIMNLKEGRAKLADQAVRSESVAAPSPAQAPNVNKAKTTQSSVPSTVVAEPATPTTASSKLNSPSSDQSAMAEMQRQLNAQVMAMPFSVEDSSKIDAYVRESMQKDIKPRNNPPAYWQSGNTCESIRSRSWTDFRDCAYYQRYYGRLW